MAAPAARQPDRGLLLSLELGGGSDGLPAGGGAPLTPSASPVRGGGASPSSHGRYAKLGGGEDPAPAAGDDAPASGLLAVDHRKLGALSVAVISFGSVAGGPYGIEAAVGAAGALPTLVGCAALAFLWSAPQALVTAELATAFPSNGGYITWGVRGLGPVLGFVNAANCVASAVCNLPLYPVLFASYIATLDPALSPWVLGAIKAAALALAVGLNLAGIQAVEVAGLLFTVIVQLPFILMPLVAAAGGSPAFAWGAGPASVLPGWRANFAVFVSTLCWNAQGWVNVGNLASDVRNPRVAYPAGSALAVALVSLNYIYPVWVCSALAPDAAAWDTGYFATIGSSVAPWLGLFTTAASLFSCANNFLPQLGTTSRALRYCALYRMLPLPGLAANWRWGGGCGGGGACAGRARGAAPDGGSAAAAAPPARRPGASAPGVAILLQGALCGVLMNFSFDVLVIVNVLFYNVGLMLQFGAFLALKHSRPELPRPFQVPGGLAGAWVTAAAFAGVLCCAFYAAAVSSPWAMLILLAANIVFVAGGLAWARWGFHEGLLDEVDAAEARADADAAAAAGAGAGEGAPGTAAGTAAGGLRLLLAEPDTPAGGDGSSLEAGAAAMAARGGGSKQQQQLAAGAATAAAAAAPFATPASASSASVDEPGVVGAATRGASSSGGGGGASGGGGGGGGGTAAVKARAGGRGVLEEAARGLLSHDHLHAGSGSSSSSSSDTSSSSSNSSSSVSNSEMGSGSSSRGGSEATGEGVGFDRVGGRGGDCDSSSSSSSSSLPRRGSLHVGAAGGLEGAACDTCAAATPGRGDEGRWARLRGGCGCTASQGGAAEQHARALGWCAEAAGM
jgi:amino acid transporter